MLILPPLGLASLHLSFPMACCAPSLLNTHCFSPSLSHKHVHSQWQESKYFPLAFTYIFISNYIFAPCFSLTLISLASPALHHIGACVLHYTRLFHQALEMYIDLVHACLHTIQVTCPSCTPCLHSPNIPSLSALHGDVSSCLLTCIL